MPDPIPWEQWRKKAQESYKKGTYTAKDMVQDWGFPSDKDPNLFRIVFAHGSPFFKDRNKIKERLRRSGSKRNRLATTSTNLADVENKRQAQTHKQILDEASLFALSDQEFSSFVEHNLNINQFADFAESGAPDDPDNKSINSVVEGINKTSAENYLTHQGLDKKYTILQDEQTGGMRLVAKRQFNEFGFASEQGVPFNTLEDLKLSIKQPTVARTVKAVLNRGAIGLAFADKVEQAEALFTFAADQNNVDRAAKLAESIPGPFKPITNHDTDLAKRANGELQNGITNVVNGVNGITNGIKEALPTSNGGTPRSNGRNRAKLQSQY